MTYLVPTSWPSLSRWHHEFNQRLQDQFGVTEGAATNAAGYAWFPAVDIVEEPNRFVIKADIPGVAPEGVEITLDNGVLTLRGGRQEELAESAGLRRTERISGSFYRRFALPDGVDAEQIVARGAHGVLEISIPKVTKAQPRRIEVVH